MRGRFLLFKWFSEGCEVFLKIENENAFGLVQYDFMIWFIFGVFRDRTGCSGICLCAWHLCLI